MQEEWKDISEYKGYQVSNLGRVRTHNKTTYTRNHGIRHWKSRILKFKGKSYKTGYRVDLWKDGKNKTFLVARLVAFTFFNEDINNKELTVNHMDGNRLNNNINNLELISLKENIQHGFRTNLYHTSKKVKLINKINGTIIYPSSLSEGSKLIDKYSGYLSEMIRNNIWEDDKYIWKVLRGVGYVE